jgi:hypothetical protein
MITQFQYKNNVFNLNPNTVASMHDCLQNENPIDMLAYIFKISQKDGISLKRFFKSSELIRSIFFAMNPAYPDYEKVRMFFEYSHCIVVDIPTNTFSQLEMAIYTIIQQLRNLYIQSEN